MAVPAPAPAAPAQAAAAKPTNWSPSAKVSAGVIAAAVTTLLLSYAKTHGWKEISGGDGAALTTVITFVIQYLVPERT